MFGILVFYRGFILLVTAATATTDTAAAGRCFLTEVNMVIQIGLHRIPWQLHTVCCQHILFPGLDLFFHRDVLDGPASGDHQDQANYS